MPVCRSGGSFGGSSSYGGARSYSAPRTSYGPGYSPTYTSPTIIQPRVVPSFGFGFGYPVMYGGGGSSLFSLLILAIFAYVAFNAISGSFGCALLSWCSSCFDESWLVMHSLSAKDMALPDLAGMLGLNSRCLELCDTVWWAQRQPAAESACFQFLVPGSWLTRGLNR